MLYDGLLIIFFAGGAVQSVFYIITIIKLSGSRPKNGDRNEPAPVSVIICAHNEIQNLQVLIPALTQQNYPDFEIVIVDDRSTDDTYEYLYNLAGEHRNLKLVRVDFTPDHVNEKKYALTLGIKAAKYDDLLLTDADCVPSGNGWISSMMTDYDPASTFVLGFSYYMEQKGFLNLLIRHETIQTALQYLTLAMLGMPYMGVGRNLGYRKSFFLSKKGFNTIKGITGGDDDLFVNKYATGNNTRVVISPDSVILSKPKTSWREYFIQKKRHLSVGKKYVWRHKLILGILSFAKLVCWIPGLVLLMLLPELLYPVAAVILIQLLLLLWSFITFKNKTGVKYPIWMVMPMDFVYISYLITFGLAAVNATRIKWN